MQFIEFSILKSWEWLFECRFKQHKYFVLFWVHVHLHGAWCMVHETVNKLKFLQKFLNAKSHKREEMNVNVNEKGHHSFHNNNNNLFSRGTVWHPNYNVNIFDGRCVIEFDVGSIAYLVMFEWLSSKFWVTVNCRLLWRWNANKPHWIWMKALLNIAHWISATPHWRSVQMKPTIVYIYIFSLMRKRKWMWMWMYAPLFFSFIITHSKSLYRFVRWYSLIRQEDWVILSV